MVRIQSALQDERSRSSHAATLNPFDIAKMPRREGSFLVDFILKQA
jgi:hypothetical protein